MQFVILSQSVFIYYLLKFIIKSTGSTRSFSFAEEYLLLSQLQQLSAIYRVCFVLELSECG